MAATKISDARIDESGSNAVETVQGAGGLAQDYYDDPQNDVDDPYLERMQPIKLSPEEYERFVGDCLSGPPRLPNKNLLRAMKRAKEMGIE